MGAVIVGAGACVPDRVVTNDDLARIMDTDHDWIMARTGVAERRFADPGTGASDLGAGSVSTALEDARIGPEKVDAVVTATMTPDQFAPGIAGAVQAKAGLSCQVFDVRQQCAGFLFGLDLADMLIATDRADTVVVVGAEVHAGYLPWGQSWDVLLTGRGTVSTEQRSINDDTRSWSILFGDGAGALVVQRGEDGRGMLASTLHTDGTNADLIVVPGLGFTRQPFVDAAQLAAGLHYPRMDGGGLFRQAVRRMPEAVETAAQESGVEVGDLDFVFAHQANQRIVSGVARRLHLDEGRVPTNLHRYGNTTAATIPLVFEEWWSNGAIVPGTLLAFTAFGAGAHWGAITYRH